MVHYKKILVSLKVVTMACYKYTILMAVFARMPRIVLNPDVSYSFNIPTQSL